MEFGLAFVEEGDAEAAGAAAGLVRSFEWYFVVGSAVW